MSEFTGTQFSGMTFQQLINEVDRVIERSKQITAEIEAHLRDDKPEARILQMFCGTTCENCSQPYELHGSFDDACPVLDLHKGRTKFKEQRCENPIPLNGDGTEAVECGKDCINGSRLCKEHYDEELI